MMTIGINFMYKITKIDDLKIKMQIWDTAGQDKYKTITQNYYKNCNGAFVVFSIDSKESFYSVSNFLIIMKETGSKTWYRQLLKRHKWCLSGIKWILKNKEKSVPNKPINSLNNTTFHTLNAALKVVSRYKKLFSNWGKWWKTKMKEKQALSLTIMKTRMVQYTSSTLTEKLSMKNVVVEFTIKIT